MSKSFLDVTATAGGHSARALAGILFRYFLVTYLNNDFFVQEYRTGRIQFLNILLAKLLTIAELKSFCEVNFSQVDTNYKYVARNTSSSEIRN